MIISNPSEQLVMSHIAEYNRYRQSDFLILCGEEAPVNYEKLISILNEKDIAFCGGIFPSVIFNKKSYSDRVLILPVNFESQPVVIQGLDNGKIDIPSLFKPKESNSLFILADGLSNYISKFIFELYDNIGSDYQVFGSGAGFGSFERKNCMFTHEGFYMDAAVVVSLKDRIDQSIRHGWKPIAGPYIVTKTSANLLQEINWEPAYNTYKNILEEQESVTVTRDNYYDHAKYYPFGIYRSNGEYLIRDPVSVASDHAIRFGAEIPINSVLYLMKAETEDMIQTSKDACTEVIARCKNPSFLFVADCISRTWVLGNDFDRELENIDCISKQKNVPVYGVFSMGEISSSLGSLMDYHHKTVVITIIEKNE